MNYFKHSFLNLSVVLAIAALAVLVGHLFTAENLRTSYAQTTGGTSTPPPPPAATTDTVLPTPPTVLNATEVATGGIVLAWSGALDNVGVVGYKVFRNGAWYANVSGTTYTDQSVTTGTNYMYAVRAVDVAGNESVFSMTAMAGGATATNPFATVTYSVSPTSEVICEDGTARTTVVLTSYPVSGGYYRLRSSAGLDAMMEPGAYPFSNATYYWEGIARTGFTSSGTTQGSFALTASCTSANTVTPPTPPSAIPPTAPPTTTATSTALGTVTTPPVVSPPPPATHVTDTKTSTTVVRDTTKEMPVAGGTKVAPPPPPVTHPHVETSPPAPSPVPTPEPKPVAVTPEAGMRTCSSEEDCVRLCADGKNSTLCAGFATERLFVRPLAPTTTPEVSAADKVTPPPVAPSPEKVAEEKKDFIAFVSARVGARTFLDTDQDGVTDFDEVNIYGTDPTKEDSDNDGMTDETEILMGSDPLAAETPEPAARAMTATAPGEAAPAEGTENTDTAKWRVAFGNPKAEGPVIPEFATTTGVSAHTEVDTRASTTRNLLTFEGHSIPNSIVTLFIFSDPIVVRVKTDDTGAWTYTLDKELADGSHQMYSAITDASGKILAKSDPLPFVKQAAAVSIGSELAAAPAAPAAPGFMSNSDMIALVLVFVGVLGIALSVIGFVVRRRRDDIDPPLTPPGSATLPPTILPGGASSRLA